MKKTKLVATIGPSSSTEEVIRKFIEGGMNVARLNFSHGDYVTHQEKINTLKHLIEEGANIAIMLDTKGPEIRTYSFEGGQMTYHEGDQVRILMHDVVGNKECFGVTYQGLYDDLSVGNRVRLDDGRLTFQIVAKDEEKRELICLALNTHTVNNRRNVIAPFARLKMPYLSEKDNQDLLFGCRNDLDYIAASFSRKAEDILQIRQVLASQGKERIQIIAKIENQEGVDNFKEILQVSDGIMVARGDLGVEIAPEEVPVAQKMMVSECKKQGKQVIVATHMLDSMQKTPNPTRAEVSDVANAIFESCDAIMLSGESASGDFPVESVQMETRIAQRMEQILDYRRLVQEGFESAKRNHNDAIAFSVANILLLSDFKLIIAFSESGTTARRISKFRPSCPIVSVSTDQSVVRSLCLAWGVFGKYVSLTELDSRSYEDIAIDIAKEYGVLPNENVIVTGGNGRGSTNFIKIITAK